MVFPAPLSGKALRDLQGRGLLETRQGQGSFVTDIVPEPEDRSVLMQSFIGHASTLFDLYEVREQLEGQAASLAAQRGSKKDFYKITKAFHALEKIDVNRRISLGLCLSLGYCRSFSQYCIDPRA